MAGSPYKAATNVLLIEDRPSDAELVRACLEGIENEEFHITHAADLTAAIPMLTTQNLHAVMLDLFLPDTDELNGLASIQSMAPNMPVLILTGRDDEELASKAVERGAQDYIVKDRIDGKMLQRSIRYAIRRKFYQSGIVQQANFDQLTGLPNRDLFRDRLNAALARQQRTSQKIVLMMLDLNEFKSVNDNFGHDAGDILLKEIGHRIGLCLRPYDVAARLGGDEFVVLIEDVRNSSDCAAVAQKLINAIEELVIIEPWRLSVGASIGITLCNATDSSAPDTLLRQADEAMYAAKKQDRSCYRFYGQNGETPKYRRSFTPA